MRSLTPPLLPGAALSGALLIASALQAPGPEERGGRAGAAAGASTGIAASWDALRGLVLFVGPPHAGTTLLGTLLDANPRVVVPNEYDLLMKIGDRSAEDIFGSLYEEAAKQASHQDERLVGGPLVQGQWQGAAQDGRPYFIGDKRAAHTAALKVDDLCFLLQRLVNMTGLPLKLIYVTRNPYDNIASMAAIKHFKTVPIQEGLERRREFESSVDAGLEAPLKLPLEPFVRFYFEMIGHVHALSERLRKSPNYFGVPTEIVHIDFNSFVTNPVRQLGSLCSQLGIECTKDYLEACARSVSPKDHHTWQYLQWDRQSMCSTALQASAFPSLRGHLRNGSMSVGPSIPSGCSMGSLSAR